MGEKYFAPMQTPYPTNLEDYFQEGFDVAAGIP